MSTLLFPRKAPHLALRHASISCLKARCSSASTLQKGPARDQRGRISPEAHCQRPARRGRITALAYDLGLHRSNEIREQASTPPVRAQLAAVSQTSTIFFRFVERRRQDHRPGIERPWTATGLIKSIELTR
ncbi:hypothetical protein [Burkholderia ubonensis]|uniref:hypothetical protein n=1 Tax=Burkholderia ubonensis TaxID=101571 RepID=UPI0012F889BE|nr:hypothetical protein [Burkholderia ubonensis]